MPKLPPVSKIQLAQIRSRPGRINAAQVAGRHRRILDAARALFVARGLTGTSFDAIADEASITKRTIYVLYNSKEGLFVEVLKDCVDVISSKVRNAHVEPTDLVSLLTNLTLQYLHALDDADTCAIYRLAIGESARLPAEALSTINLYGSNSAMGVVQTRLLEAEELGLVKFISIHAFVHLFIDLILSPRFCRWLIGYSAALPDPIETREAVLRFLRASDDLYRIPPC